MRGTDFVIHDSRLDYQPRLVNNESLVVIELVWVHVLLENLSHCCRLLVNVQFQFLGLVHLIDQLVFFAFQFIL